MYPIQHAEMERPHKVSTNKLVQRNYIAARTSNIYLDHCGWEKPTGFNPVKPRAWYLHLELPATHHPIVHPDALGLKTGS